MQPNPDTFNPTPDQRSYFSKTAERAGRLASGLRHVMGTVGYLSRSVATLQQEIAELTQHANSIEQDIAWLRANTPMRSRGRHARKQAVATQPSNR